MQGCTVLHHAVANKKLAAVQLLLAHGADVNAVDIKAGPSSTCFPICK